MQSVVLATLLCLGAEPVDAAKPVLLKPARVFDSIEAKPHVGWVVLVRGDKIVAAGPTKSSN